MVDVLERQHDISLDDAKLKREITVPRWEP
jgi:hypothetical protein